jgi:hypothetical protein
VLVELESADTGAEVCWVELESADAEAEMLSAGLKGSVGSGRE